MRLGSTVTGQMRDRRGAAASRSRPRRSRGRTGSRGVGGRSARRRRSICATIELVRHDPARVVVAQGLEAGDIVVTAGVQALRPGQQVRLLGGAAMIGPNLSEWAVSRRSLIVYFMIAAVVAGSLSFFRLGRNEDPAFTFRTMVVQAAWPGATLDDTVLQVTERIERRLQEVAGLDFLTSYTRPGITTIFVNLRGDTRGRGRAGPLVRRPQEDRRHPPHAAAAGCVGPVLQRRVRRRLRHHLRLHRRRLHPSRAARLRRGCALAPAAGARRLARSRSSAPRTSRSSSSSRASASPRSASTTRPWSRRSRRRTRCARRASCRPATSGSRCASRARSIPSSTSSRVNFVVGDRVVRLGDIAEVRRGYADPPQPMFRVNGEPAIGARHRDARGRRHPGARPEHRARDGRDPADLPIGIEPHLVADQAVTVDHAIDEFTTSLWQAIVIIIAASFVSLGVRPGAVVALSIPLTLAIVFPIMEFVRHRPAADLARRADHRARRCWSTTR